MNITMIDDKIIPQNQVPEAYRDRAYFFGDGVYEVVRSYGSKIFALEEHLQRFDRSLREIEIHNIDMNVIRDRVEEAFKEANFPNSMIYFHITRGSAERHHTWEDDIKPNFFLTVSKMPDETDKMIKGISACTHPDLRWKRCDIKTLNLLPNVMARQAAMKKGCLEAILVNDEGLITEGAGSSFFAIFDNELHIPPLTANILPSVTRHFALKAAKAQGMKIVEKSITPDQAKKADELCIAVTTAGVVNIVKFDGQTIGDGKQGKYTKLIAETFNKV